MGVTRAISSSSVRYVTGQRVSTEGSASIVSKETSNSTVKGATFSGYLCCQRKKVFVGRGASLVPRPFPQSADPGIPHSFVRGRLLGMLLKFEIVSHQINLVALEKVLPFKFFVLIFSGNQSEAARCFSAFLSAHCSQPRFAPLIGPYARPEGTYHMTCYRRF